MVPFTPKANLNYINLEVSITVCHLCEFGAVVDAATEISEIAAKGINDMN
jgi:hypothetical protein